MPDVRRGELSEQSLVDALAAERAEGRRPTQLAVGSRLLEVRAVNILCEHEGGLGDLRSVAPNVLVDATLPDDGWELRE